MSPCTPLKRVFLVPFLDQPAHCLVVCFPLTVPASSDKGNHPSLSSGFPIFSNFYTMVNFWPKKDLISRYSKNPWKWHFYVLLPQWQFFRVIFGVEAFLVQLKPLQLLEHNERLFFTGLSFPWIFGSFE